MREIGSTQWADMEEQTMQAMDRGMVMPTSSDGPGIQWVCPEAVKAELRILQEDEGE